VLDGDSAFQAPANGAVTLPRLTAGRHLRIPGGGTNPDRQFIDLVESDPPRAITYQIGCAQDRDGIALLR
jgi:hypothetical protein